ncbi:MAG TPA: ankyrin repeat domain-containing protein [Candidatus Bathyarchaeia archaeon]|nr:ankyrin repeat domain-containing protein [Candidatus Bathyarchaeia archaeon]
MKKILHFLSGFFCIVHVMSGMEKNDMNILNLNDFVENDCERSMLVLELDSKPLISNKGVKSAVKSNFEVKLHGLIYHAPLAVQKFFKNGKGVTDAHIEATAGKYDLWPIHVAAFTGNKEIVHYLAQKAGHARARDKKGWEPLHYAAVGNHAEIIKCLCEHGVDVNTCTNSMQTPLQQVLSIIWEQPALQTEASGETLLMLLQCKAIPYPYKNLYDISQFSWSQEQFQKGICHLIVSGQGGFFSRMLVKAVENNWIENTQILIDNGAGCNAVDAINVCGDTPLHIAVMKKFCCMTKLLISAGADVNIQNKHTHFTPLYTAMKNMLMAKNEEESEEYGDIVEECLADSVVIDPTKQVDMEGNTLLHIIVRSKEWAASVLGNFAEQLKEKNIFDVNARNKQGETPLYVCVKDYIEMAKKHEEISLQKDCEATHASLFKMQKDNLLYSIQCLKNHGADSSLADNNKITPLALVDSTRNKDLSWSDTIWSYLSWSDSSYTPDLQKVVDILLVDKAVALHKG